MSEPTPEPTLYDEIQDTYISALQEIVTPYNTPPGGIEYSFPVVGQGISADQYRLMSLGQANGIIHGDNGIVNDSPNSTGWRYYLDGHATDAETNQRNTLMLRAGTSAEAIVEGFYHRLTQDLELSFPPVTTSTTYHVCLTYDPLEEANPAGPISVQVYANTPPTSNRRVHLLLHTVQREPNQLLSQATKTRYRPYTAGLLSVQNRNQLPDPAEYPAGTVVVPSAEGHGIYVRQNGGHRWLDPVAHKANEPGPWRSLQLSTNALEVSGTAVYREVAEGIQIHGHLSTRVSPSGSYLFSFPSSSGISFKRSWYDTCSGAAGNVGTLYADVSNYSERGVLAIINSRYQRFNTIIPDYVLD